MSGSVAMETIIYFHLGNLCHYGLEVRWEKKTKKKNPQVNYYDFCNYKEEKREKKDPTASSAYINRTILFNSKKKTQKNIRLAFYFLSVFSGADPTVINLLYDLFDLLKRPTITVTLY